MPVRIDFNARLEENVSGMEAEEEHIDLKGVFWMLSSAILFAANTLFIRAASLASAEADVDGNAVPGSDRGGVAAGFLFRRKGA